MRNFFHFAVLYFYKHSYKMLASNYFPLQLSISIISRIFSFLVEVDRIHWDCGLSNQQGLVEENVPTIIWCHCKIPSFLIISLHFLSYQIFKRAFKQIWMPTFLTCCYWSRGVLYFIQCWGTFSGKYIYIYIFLNLRNRFQDF